jgi:alcohol dehydrogenase, propanol-preferring
MQTPKTMLAMVLEKKPTGIGEKLKEKEIPVPFPTDSQVLIKIKACGVCHTDLHIVDGELTKPKLPLIPGHEIVGVVVKKGKNVRSFKEGDRVGVPWLGYTCGHCRYCKRGQENLCENALFTGYTLDGGYAQYTTAEENYCFNIPDMYNYIEAAPLLCAGLIGYRTYRMAGNDIKNLGIYGFGAAAHIVAQIAVHQGKKVFAFTRTGDTKAQNFARKLGAVWAGGSDEAPPEKLDAALIFAPVGALIPAALKVSVKGAAIISGGIHMSDIPSFPYRLLWEERIMRSVANLTRGDGEELLKIAPEVPVKTEVIPMPLNEANEALNLLREGKVEGALVLEIPD